MIVVELPDCLVRVHVLAALVSLTPVVPSASATFSESEVYDYGLWQMRAQLSTIQGLTLPAPRKAPKVRDATAPANVLGFNLVPRWGTHIA